MLEIVQKCVWEIILVVEEEFCICVELNVIYEWVFNLYLEAGVEFVCEVVEELGYLYQEIFIVVGYDLMNMKEYVLIVMFFILSVDGVFYNEVEYIKDEDCVVGFDVFIYVVI